jgi:hypothetical protein
VSTTKFVLGEEWKKSTRKFLRGTQKTGHNAGGNHMTLKLLDRLLLLKALPKEGSFANLKIVQELKSHLALSEDEFKEYEIKEDDHNLTWNPEKDLGKEIPIGEKANDIIVMSLKKRDKDGALTEQEIPVYEKFIKGD